MSSDEGKEFYNYCLTGDLIQVQNILKINKDLDINQIVEHDNNNWTPLLAACSKNQIDIVKELMKHPKLDINKSCSNLTALFMATQYKYFELVCEILKDPVVDVNVVDRSGFTPINYAAKYGYIDIVKELLKHPKIDIDKPNKNGRSPICVSLYHNQQEIANCLKQYRKEVLKIKLEDEIEFVKNNLIANSPFLSKAITYFMALLFDTETQNLIPQDIFIEKMNNLLEEKNFKLNEECSNLIFWVFQIFSTKDNLRKLLIKSETISKSANFFVSNTEIQGKLLYQLRIWLPGGIDIRQAFFTGNKMFLDSLVLLLNDPNYSLLASSIVMLAAVYIPNSEQVLDRSKEILFKAIVESDEDNRNLALDCLMENAAMEEIRPTLVSLGAQELLNPFCEDKNSEINFVSSLIQALLSANDVSLTSESGTKATSPFVIKRVIDALDTFASTKVNRIATAKAGYHANCQIILTATRSLATNETNYKELVGNNIEIVLLNLLSKRKEDIFLTSSDSLKEAAYVIWTLSFRVESRNKFISQGAIELLKSFLIDCDEQVKRGINGALWNLDEHFGRKTNQIHNNNNNNSSSNNNNDNKNNKIGQVMISYSWGQKERMRQLGYYLKSLGIPIWIDVEEMTGSVLEKMADAVEESSIIIIGFSTTYKDSQACRTEAEYAYQLKKKIIFVRAEDDYSARGWLGAILGSSLWYSPWSHPDGFEQGMTSVVKVIQQYNNSGNNSGNIINNSNNNDDELIPLANNNNNTFSSQSNGDLMILLQQILQKVDTLSSRVDSLTSTINSVSSNVDLKIDSLSNKVDENFNSLSTTVNLLSTKIDNLSNPTTARAKVESSQGSFFARKK